MAAMAVSSEIDRLRAYLVEWAAWQREHRPKLGYPGSTLGRFMKSASPRATEILEWSDSWAMTVVEASVDDLIPMPDGVLMRAALRARYLSEGMDRDGNKIKCFRRGEIFEFGVAECDTMADRAEVLLVPLAKRRGLPL